ncbi:MAG: STAS domain-containing protein [Acidobacteria bacterium]|nr:STAS domain-containing protein [Acidobacteriota bacterium]
MKLLNVIIENVGGQLTFHLQGKLVCGEDTKLVCAALRHAQREIMLNLSGLTAIDARGLGALVSLQAAGFYLRLANPTRNVLELLARTKLDSIFEVLEAEPFAGVNREAAREPALAR